MLGSDLVLWWEILVSRYVDSEDGALEQRGSRLDGIRTVIPPSCSHAEVLTVCRFRYHAVLLMPLGDGVVGLTGAFFD